MAATDRRAMATLRPNRKPAFVRPATWTADADATHSPPLGWLLNRVVLSRSGRQTPTASLTPTVPATLAPSAASVPSRCAGRGPSCRESQGPGRANRWHVTDWARDRWDTLARLAEPTSPEMSGDLDGTPETSPEMSGEVQSTHETGGEPAPLSLPLRAYNNISGEVPPEPLDALAMARNVWGDELAEGGAA
jgi:hypothetical protein